MAARSADGGREVIRFFSPPVGCADSPPEGALQRRAAALTGRCGHRPLRNHKGHVQWGGQSRPPLQTSIGDFRAGRRGRRPLRNGKEYVQWGGGASAPTNLPPTAREVAARSADGGREVIRFFSPPVGCADSPLPEGALQRGAAALMGRRGRRPLQNRIIPARNETSGTTKGAVLSDSAFERIGGITPRRRPRQRREPAERGWTGRSSASPRRWR